ncbi:8191_t:CDS:2 [Diversispora eburnea]|uniref:8191_t:CDS:1 n=1 Tax=Diversispora eburnea TaxID=1213867 RepID=A0A9N9CN31_9GLOM|nr:8191_t:CDS:2 [Diversispora eburnea]
MGLGFSCLGLGAASWISSCLASCFSAAACSLAFKSCNCNNSIATRVGFAIIFLMNSMLAWIMLTDWAIKQLENISYGYLKLNCEEGTCYGVLAVHRICFAFSFFHFILGLLVLKVNDTRDKRASIQNGWWGPKILLWLLLIIISFFIPNQFFMFWGNYIALIGSTVFIIVGLVLLVDFAHSWCETCIEKWEGSDNNKWKYILVASTLTKFLGVVIFTGIMYGFFAGSGCRLNQFFITFNLILCLIGTLFSVHPVIQEANPRSGLSQASMVMVYCTYLILSAVANEPIDPDDENGSNCNPLIKSRGTQTTTVMIGAMFTFVAIAYSTSRAATQDKALINKSDYHPVNTATAINLNNSNSLLASVESGYSYFHFIFAIGAMYTAMLLTNWNNVSTNTDELITIGQTYTAVWVKVVSSWICLILYFWTLVGPVIMPERFEMY